MEDFSAAAEFCHTPVLLDECVEALNVRADGVYFDGTLGGAGHARAVCAKLRGGVFIGCDRDDEAVRASDKLNIYAADNGIKIFKARYNDIGEILEKAGQSGLDGALLDLGVSSRQLDTAERGFSYMRDGELDMRMDVSQELTARDIVNTYDEKRLAKIFYEYGEERWSARVAEFIVNERQSRPINTTFELVSVIKRAIPKAARQEGIHPAKKVFQAIRIETNGEIEGLGKACRDIAEKLNKGGRLAVITFHSLEDRAVKQEFKALENPCPTCPAPIGDPCKCERQGLFTVITKKPILPAEEEIITNPRARSAKLRVIEKN